MIGAPREKKKVQCVSASLDGVGWAEKKPSSPGGVGPLAVEQPNGRKRSVRLKGEGVMREKKSQQLSGRGDGREATY